MVLFSAEKSVEEILNSGKEKKRTQWQVTARNGISFPFDGIPFLSAGSVRYMCHQGVDIDMAAKIARKNKQNEMQVRCYQELYKWDI